MPVPLLAWIAALGLAVIVVAFCVYEVSWKAKRLRRDLARLRGVVAQLQAVQADAADVQRRLAGLRAED